MDELMLEQPVPDLSRPTRKAYLRVGAALFAMAAITVGLQLASLALNNAGLLAAESEWAQWAYSLAPLYLAAVPVALLILRGAPRDEAPGEPLSFKRFLLFLLFCFPLMYAGNLIGTLLSLLLSGFQAENPLSSLAGSDNVWLKLLFMVILAPLVEEFVFRKQLIDRTVRYGEKTAILFSGLSFGLFHMNLYQFFYAAALGLLFGYVYVRTRRLHYTVALHMIVNFLGGVVAPWVVKQSVLAPFGELAVLDDMDDLAPILQETGRRLLPLLGGLLYVNLLLGASVAGLVLLIVRRRRLDLRAAEGALTGRAALRCAFLTPGYILFTLVCLGVFVWHLFG